VGRLGGAGRLRSHQLFQLGQPDERVAAAAERPLPGRPAPRPTTRLGFFPTPSLRENGAVVAPERSPIRCRSQNRPTAGHTTPQSGRRHRRRSDSSTARRAGRRSPGRRRSVGPLPGASCAITTAGSSSTTAWRCFASVVFAPIRARLAGGGLARLDHCSCGQGPGNSIRQRNERAHEPTLAALLFDGSESGAGGDRAPVDTSLSPSNGELGTGNARAVSEAAACWSNSSPAPRCPKVT
jgi:hypothetical protein